MELCSYRDSVGILMTLPDLADTGHYLKKGINQLRIKLGPGQGTQLCKYRILTPGFFVHTLGYEGVVHVGNGDYAAPDGYLFALALDDASCFISFKECTRGRVYPARVPRSVPVFMVGQGNFGGDGIKIGLWIVKKPGA